jgi:hypothetical protein
LLKKFKIIILFLFLIQGCGLFNTREVEQPVDPRSNFIPPTAPEIVIVNFITAITEKNLNNYMACFVDTTYSTRKFSYTADIASQIQYPVFRYWNLSYENSYFTNLRSLTNPASSSNLFLSNEIVTTTIDTVVYDSDYLLHVEHQKQAVAQTVKGKLRLVLSADSRNLWSIHRWIDYKVNDGDTTWSVLKANFTN